MSWRKKKILKKQAQQNIFPIFLSVEVITIFDAKEKT